MLRLAPLLLLLFAGCQRPVAAVLTYAPAPVAGATNQTDSADMNRAASVVQQRLRSGRLPCRVSLDDSQNVRIEAFEDDPNTLDRMDRVVTALGTFELRIVVNPHDHKSLIDQAQGSDEDEIRDDQDQLLAWWVPIDGGANNKMLDSTGLTTRVAQRGGVSETELLVVKDPYDVNGGLLVRAAPGIDQSGRPNLSFSLSKKGALMMAALTTDNLPDADSKVYRQLAIILNGRVFSAPRIQSTIGERGQITGNFTKQEVQDLVDVLNAGSLPVPLRRVSLKYVGDGP